MNRRSIGRLLRSLVLIGMVAIAGVGLTAQPDIGLTSVALAGVAQGNENSDNNDDPTDDNSEERVLRGQVIEIMPDMDPPMLVVAAARDELISVRVYNEQIPRNGLNQGDHVRLQGEYNRGIFDAYEIDVTDRCCPGPDNDND